MGLLRYARSINCGKMSADAVRAPFFWTETGGELCSLRRFRDLYIVAAPQPYVRKAGVSRKQKYIRERALRSLRRQVATKE